MAEVLLLALQEQHALLSLLCERVRSALTSEERQHGLAEFSKALIAHLACLDSVLLPAIVDQRDALSGLIEGPSALRRALADAVGTPVDGPAFAGAVEAVATRLEEHLAAESTLLCPLLAAFSESEQVLLASELELEMARFGMAGSGAGRGEDR